LRSTNGDLRCRIRHFAVRRDGTRYPEIEDAMGWPRRRISSVLGGVGRVRKLEFGGRRPYHFQDERQSASGRWEIWMDGDQAEYVLAARRD